MKKELFEELLESEQGRRAPEGSARVLLRVVERHPEAVLDVVAHDRGV